MFTKIILILSVFVLSSCGDDLIIKPKLFSPNGVELIEKAFSKPQIIDINSYIAFSSAFREDNPRVFIKSKCAEDSLSLSLKDIKTPKTLLISSFLSQSKKLLRNSFSCKLFVGTDSSNFNLVFQNEIAHTIHIEKNNLDGDDLIDLSFFAWINLERNAQTVVKFRTLLERLSEVRVPQGIRVSIFCSKGSYGATNLGSNKFSWNESDKRQYDSEMCRVVKSKIDLSDLRANYSMDLIVGLNSLVLKKPKVIVKEPCGHSSFGVLSRPCPPL